MTPKQFLMERHVSTELIEVFANNDRFGFYPLEQLLTDYAESIRLTQTTVGGQHEELCGAFESSTNTSSVTNCKHCGREKWLHPKVK
jgi:hypothetical protein